MKYQQSLKAILLLGLLISLNACVKDGDFSAEETANALPIGESNLIVTTLDATNFKENSSHQQRIIFADTMAISFGTSEFSVEQLTGTNLTFKFINTFSTEFRVDFLFLNDVDEMKYKVHVPISSGTLDSPSSVETIVFVEEPEIESFKVATKLVYKITLPINTTSLVSDSEGTLALQSKATFFFDN